MKKQIIILVFLGIHLQSFCQKSYILTSGKCNDSVLMSIKGKYRLQEDYIIADISSILSREQEPEVSRRVEAVNKLLQEAYPQPTGNEGNWWWNGGIYLFAHNYKFTTGIPICNYSYTCSFGPYLCGTQPKEVNYFSVTTTSCKVFANQWTELRNQMMMDSGNTINGVPFYMLNPVKEKWKGYDLYYESTLDTRRVLLHREGMLPYIPVTRKQYLDYSINRFNKMFDDMIKSSKEMPFSTQQQKDETVKTIIKQKNAVIELYEKELEKTRTANLLDSPAIVRILDNMYPDVPIFTTGAEDGSMLVTENPAYIRKDLPKYVPQFIILYWSWGDRANSKYFRQMFEANFPIEKLQAMIDK